MTAEDLWRRNPMDPYLPRGEIDPVVVEAIRESVTRTGREIWVPVAAEEPAVSNRVREPPPEISAESWRTMFRFAWSDLDADYMDEYCAWRESRGFNPSGGQVYQFFQWQRLIDEAMEMSMMLIVE